MIPAATVSATGLSFRSGSLLFFPSLSREHQTTNGMNYIPRIFFRINSVSNTCLKAYMLPQVFISYPHLIIQWFPYPSFFLKKRKENVDKQLLFWLVKICVPRKVKSCQQQSMSYNIKTIQVVLKFPLLFKGIFVLLVSFQKKKEKENKCLKIFMSHTCTGKIKDIIVGSRVFNSRSSWIKKSWAETILRTYYWFIWQQCLMWRLFAVCANQIVNN